MINDAEFTGRIQRFSSNEPTLVMFLNKHVLNMTLNWLCNTKHMEGVHERTVMVTLDDESNGNLAQLWPNIARLPFVVPCLKDPFSYGDGRYQLFFVLRSNIARAFVELGRPLWMIQQDTFWYDNLLNLKLDGYNEAADIVFDRALDGDRPLIAGGYYMAKPTRNAQAFFRRLSTDLEKCTLINWMWLHSPVADSSGRPPMLIQFDGDTKNRGKLARMRDLGFYFLNDDQQTCNSTAVENARKLVESNSESKPSISLTTWLSYSHLQFGVYCYIIDQLYKFPPTEWLLNHVIFPYAHYFLVTV
ncbi:Nucleotide-diphospho-sugar transferase [Aphelenchoides avenae]|nr:Nucleotide-diphospho-sugar transferase [Aphelenchus avenae]